MEILLSLRERLEAFYEKYDTYLISAGKFALALLAFWQIRLRMGYMDVLNSVILLLILALFCSFLPWNAVILAASGLILAHLYAYSLPALAVGGGIVLILLLIYFGIAPQEGLAVILTSICLSLGIPCLVPMIFGLLGTPFAGAGIVVGTIGYYSLRAVCAQGAGAVSSSVTETAAQETEDLLGKMNRLMQAVAGEKEMILVLIAMIAVLVLVYLIRRMAIKYAWSIGIAAGAGAYLIVTVFGGLTLGLTSLIGRALIGTLISVGVAMTLEQLFFSLDYRHTQKVQFEDDDYYYYVKAVPKRKKGRETHGEH